MTPLPPATPKAPAAAPAPTAVSETPATPPPRSTGTDTLAMAAQPSSGSKNPTVRSLIEQSDKQVQSGQLDAAAAVLERGLGIAPTDPYLWSRLAGIRLRQGEYDQAASLASRSNTLAGADKALQRSNWNLIGQALESSGDLRGAEAARTKAAQLP